MVNKEKLMAKVLLICERNLASGNWKLETAQLFSKGADEQPELYKKYLRKGN